MGARGPLPKGGERRRSSHRAKEPATPIAPVVGLPTPAPKDPPPIPRGRGWLKVTRDAWPAFWETAAAQRLEDEHLDPLVRLFDLRDERERTRRAIRATNLLVEGSKEQPRSNPLIGELRKLDAEIRQLEDRLILNPASAIRNTGAAAGAGFTLEQLNEAIQNAILQDDDEADDPRLPAVRKPARNR